VILTTPILEGLDGRKMSKSYGNHIGLSSSAKEIFGRTMSIPDALLRSWFTLVTRVPESQIREWLGEGKNPRDAKIELAKLLIEELHGKDAAEREAAAFASQFSKGEVPEDIPVVVLTAADRPPGEREIVVNCTDPVLRADLTRLPKAHVGFANFPQFLARLTGESASAARQLMAQKAVDVDGEAATDPKAVAWLKDGAVLRVGKRRYFRIRVAEK
jgi:tyrosyl-tRNA synthetase